MTDRTDPWTRLARLWPLLAITRIPGTPRPWRPAELTSAQRAERDAQLRAERHMAEVFLEAVPAPVHVDVLDILEQLHTRLWAAATEFGADRAAFGAGVRSSLGNPQPLLEWCRERARSQTDGIVADEPAWAMLHTIEQALGEIWAGQRLQADCPWCHGGITRKPSWRVRILPGNMPAIVCESGTCEPPEQDVGTWWRGNPAFPFWEWEWLAGRLEADERKRAGR